MVNIMVSYTDLDEPTTWADVTPTRKVTPVVAAADEKHLIAEKQYDDKVEYFLDNPDEWDQTALDALSAEADEAYARLQRVKNLVSNGNIHLFPKGRTGQVSIEDRNYERVSLASWERVRKLCAGKAILPGVWAYYVPRTNGG